MHRSRQAKRRMQDDARTEVPEECRSLADHPLAHNLLVRWAEGQLTANDIVELAKAACESKTEDVEVQWMSNLFHSAVGGGNASKAIYRRYLKTMDTMTPVPFDLVVPIKTNADRSIVQNQTISVLLPHDWVACIAKHNPDKFSEMFTDGIEDFWRKQVQSSHKFYKHPVLDRDYSKKAIPVIVHGDGAAFLDRDSLLILSMKPLAAQSGFVDSHLMLAAFPYSATTEGTTSRIWQCLGWSFRALLENVHPAVSFDGSEFEEDWRKELAGKPILEHNFFAVIWGLANDLEFASKELSMPWHSANHFCWRCEADKTDRPFTDFTPDSLWRNTATCIDV